MMSRMFWRVMASGVFWAGMVSLSQYVSKGAPDRMTWDSSTTLICFLMAACFWTFADTE